MSSTSREELIRRRFVAVTRKYLRAGGCSSAELRRAAGLRARTKSRSAALNGARLALALALPLLCGLVLGRSLGVRLLLRPVQEQRCLLPNNYLVWEFSRPVSDCDFCRGVDSALVLGNLTRDEFREHAYSSKPIVVKGAAGHWLASKVFSLQFFRSLYERIPGAYESVHEDCQFLHFRSDFDNLREVLHMSERRAMNLPGEAPWYVGWKNCHPQVMEVLKRFYEPPHFLPEDAEMPNSNYIFLGYEDGADMHLDYIPRLMWQGQIIGSKTWTVAPTPECDHVCGSFSFLVDTGDVVLLDTRIWYHSTRVENRHFSLTVTSEYG
ncbi:uncharacterized protein LOC131665117 isoform X1 [Phymastichus coffea]|uniref:uncharacterized protein LOC131665117 isoform X1 n=1 Tax=Phymastichus coffea TaxID=108790 RepID=UPI00273A907D|nr:uncharacterized protein LOC131665117 isoform X1 [Phymastichus coffea]XP_058792740.1 uncharacterized protein LOC131665117 isoform X1 [Phymastichus coffea]XP_058792741.1 uncharacterized protein LOC131665117 isoform X1 [Phymastichus coffea]